jgi:hypothetical protein
MNCCVKAVIEKGKSLIAVLIRVADTELLARYPLSWVEDTSKVGSTTDWLLATESGDPTPDCASEEMALIEMMKAIIEAFVKQLAFEYNLFEFIRGLNIYMT